MEKEYKTLWERYGDEKLTDNAALNHFKQCRDCVFRYKNYFVFDGKQYGCEEKDGWKKGSCHIFKHPQSKPNDVFNNTGKCDFYEKDNN